MFCLYYRFATICFGRSQTPVAICILRQLLKAMAHADLIALGDNKVARGIPHHTRAKARIAECFEQRLGFHAVIGLFVQSKAAFQPVHHSRAKA